MNGTITSGVSDQLIYTGVWINWTYGPIKGATITLTHRGAGLLTAFLALFVGVVGSRFWRLFCFVAHSLCLQQRTSQDGIYHQRQAVLRNAATGMIGLQYLAQLAWNWRNRSTRLLLRILPAISATVFIIVAFSIAGLFSSRISTAISNEVLISNEHCGVMLAPDSIVDYVQQYNSYINRRYSLALAYAQECYTNSSATQICSIYKQRRLPINVYRNISCPFPGKEICARNSTNLRLDTGFLDSHDHLGINTKPQNRFVFRHVDECAPLTLDGYLWSNNSHVYTVQNSSTEYRYGELSDNGKVIDPATFRTSPSSEAIYALHNRDADYRLSIQTYDPSDNSISSFNPIPELLQDDAQIYLLFLSTPGIQFLGQIDDDWFSAHRHVEDRQVVNHPSEQFPVYSADYPTTVLGCTSRSQTCDPNTKICSPLSVSAFQNLTWSTKAQEQMFRYWMTPARIQGINLVDMLRVMGISALQARSNFIDGLQGPLPSDQWQEEVFHWETISMANLARMTVELATGPSDESMRKFVHKKLPGDDSGQPCLNQKVRSSAYVSFSILGLSITLMIGIVITAVSYLIEPLCAYIQRRYKRDTCRHLAWVADETLQLQRMVHEDLGHGTWTGAASSIPVTEPNEHLGVLDTSNPEHPMMTHDPQGSDEAGKPNGDSQRKQSPLSKHMTAFNNTNGFKSVETFAPTARSDIYSQHSETLARDTARSSSSRTRYAALFSGQEARSDQTEAAAAAEDHVSPIYDDLQNTSSSAWPLQPGRPFNSSSRVFDVKRPGDESVERWG